MLKLDVNAVFFCDDASHIIEPRCEKTVLRGFDQVPHKPGCTSTVNSQRLESLGI